MSDFYKFASESPWLTFGLAWLLVWFLAIPFRIVNRWIRHRNIAISGWPPAHVDAADAPIKKETE